MESSSETNRRYFHCFLAILYSSIISLEAIRRIGGSLWVDEFGPVATLEPTLSATFYHAAAISQESPYYHALVWLFAKLFGISETGLRLPSFLCVVGSSLLLWKLAAKLYDALTAHLVLISFLAASSVQENLFSVRPYAFGMFFAVLAIWFLFRWRETRELRFCIAAVAAASATAYFHYTMILFGAVLAYAVVCLEHFAPQRLTRRELFILSTAAFVFLSPLLFHLAHVWSARASRGFLATPSLIDFSQGLIYVPALPLAVALGYLGAKCIDKVSWSASNWRWVTADSFFLLLFMGPPLLALLVTVVTSAKIYMVRYYLVSVVGGAVLVARLLRCFQPVGVQLMIAVAVSVLSLADFHFHSRANDENWRDAVEAINASTASGEVNTLVWSGYVEGRELKTASPLMLFHLSYPVTYYHLRGNIVLLPSELDRPQDKQMVRERVESVDYRNTPSYLLLRFSVPELMEQVSAALASRGYEAEPVGDFQAVRLYRLVPQAAASRTPDELIR